MEIKLKKDLWGSKKGEVIKVAERFSDFAIRKGYAEKIEPIKAKVAPEPEKKTKIEPGLKKRKRK